MVLSNTAVPVEYGAFRESVLRGETPVNVEVSLQMNLIDALIESPDFYYDDEAIQGFIDYCEEEMTLTDGSDLELLPSFRLWAEDALAWFYYVDEKRYNQQTRRYEYVTVKRRLRNKQYLIVGRGAAKSMYAACLQSYFQNVDTSTTHQIVTAPTAKLADETMAPIRTAISRARGPLFQFLTEGSILSNTWSKVKLASTKKGIENFMTNSLIEVRPMMIDRLQGLRSKYASVDEWLSGKVKEDVIGALEQGASKIVDYFILATSSEGTARDGVGDTIKMELLDILKGVYFNPHVSIWYYRLDDIKEINQPEMWVKANPNMGMTTSYEAVQRDVERAESVPTSRNDIIAKRFGIPVEGSTYFFLYEETLKHKKQNFDGMICAKGADLSQGDDFCAFTFLFPLGHERMGVKNLSFVSKSKYDRLPQAIAAKYDEFVEEGTLIIMDGTNLNMDEVYDVVDEFILAHGYEVITFGYDPYNSDEYVGRWKVENGEYGVEKVRQGSRTESVPLGEIKNMARDRLLIFDEEITKWTMGNAVAIQDNNGNYKLNKKRSEEKIDNVASLMDAWVAYKRNQEAFA
ncbi:TPA: hypothetical protein SIF56_004544 [Escherichia coli]|nr:hypothetical protein [Escherichia coli]